MSDEPQTGMEALGRREWLHWSSHVWIVFWCLLLECSCSLLTFAQCFLWRLYYHYHWFWCYYSYYYCSYNMVVNRVVHCYSFLHYHYIIFISIIILFVFCNKLIGYCIFTLHIISLRKFIIIVEIKTCSITPLPVLLLSYIILSFRYDRLILTIGTFPFSLKFLSPS